MPFDFLLQSLADEFGERAVGVILSGTANDGTVGAAAVKAAESHAEHPILGPFYRWIVEVEQKDRMNHQMQAANDMANL